MKIKEKEIEVKQVVKKPIISFTDNEHNILLNAFYILCDFMKQCNDTFATNKIVIDKNDYDIFLSLLSQSDDILIEYNLINENKIGVKNED